MFREVPYQHESQPLHNVLYEGFNRMFCNISHVLKVEMLVNKKLLKEVERATRIELATPTLAKSQMAGGKLPKPPILLHIFDGCCQIFSPFSHGLFPRYSHGWHPMSSK